jgi:hypothetical protein
MNLAGSMTGQQFVQYLRSGTMPPGVVVPTNPSEPGLEVHGAVDCGGSDIRGTRAAFGVIFHGPVDLANAMVKGTLDLAGCIFEDGLRLDDAEVGGSLLLAGITVESHGAPANSPGRQLLSVVGAIIKGRVDLTESTIRGDIELRGGSIDGFLDLTGVQANKILLDGLNLKGDLCLGRRRDSDAQISRIDWIDGAGIEVGRDIRLYGLRDRAAGRASAGGPVLNFHQALVRGSVVIDKQDAREEFEAPALTSVDFSGARIDGDVSFQCGRIRETFELSDARIAGNVSIGAGGLTSDTRATMKGLNLARARIEGFLWVVGAKVEQKTDLNSLTCHGVIQFANAGTQRVELRGPLNMDGVTCNSTIKMLGIMATHSVSLFSAKTRTIRFCVAKQSWDGDASSDDASDSGETSVPDQKPPADNTFYPCQIGSLDIENAHIQGSLDLSHVQIFGTPRRGGIGLKVADTRIDGNLELWSVRHFCKESDSNWADGKVRPWDFSAAITGDVVIQRTQISGDVVLTFAKVSRMIDLSDSSIGGDLKAASTLTHSALGEGEHIRDELLELDPLDDSYRVICNQLKMRMLRCDNDIDLTGLTIVADSREHGEKSDVGNLSASYIEVKGDVKLHEKGTHSSCEAYAMVPGKLDLSDSRITRLIVSAHGFPADELLRHRKNVPRDSGDGVILVRAKLGTLEIPEIAEPLRYPDPIDLEDAEIGIWRIGPPDKSDQSQRHGWLQRLSSRIERLIDRVMFKSPERQLARRYNQLLHNDTFHRSTYKAVEAALRNSGDDKPADIVYREMHRRAHRESGAWSPVFTLWGLLLRFGTNAWPLLIVILVLAAISLPIYRNPTNFEASLPFLAVNRASFTDKDDNAPTHNHPPDDPKWGWDDAAILAVHHHIPVVPLIVRNEWDAKTDPGVAYGGSKECVASNPDAWLFTTCVRQPGEDGVPLFKIMHIGAEDYMAVMEILNWIFWPILLTYWIHKAMRQ